MTLSTLKKFGIVSLASLALLAACGNNSQKETASSSAESSVSSSKVVKESSSSSSSKKATKTNVDADDEDDDDKDEESTSKSSSDASDDSIKTYGDLLKAYQAGYEKFLTDYDEAVKGTAAENEAVSKQMKATFKTALDAQEKALGAVKNRKIEDDKREDVLEKLHEYRDQLDKAIEQVKESVQ